MKANAINDAIEFKGILDEHSDMEQVKVEIAKVKPDDKNRVKVDFQGVQRANSCGIFEWLKIIIQSETSLIYTNTPWWLVQQINMNSEFLPRNSFVESLFAPFFCPDSEDNREFLLIVGKDVPILEDYSDFEFPDKEIEGRCFEPDFDPEDFFDFIAQTHVRYGATE